MEQPRSSKNLHTPRRADSQLVGGELTIRGDTEIARRVDGDVTVTSGNVVVSGVITGSLFVVGGHVTITGVVGGTVENLGGVVDVVGVVEGLVHGPRPSTRIAPDAIVGNSVAKPAPRRVAAQTSTTDDGSHSPPGAPSSPVVVERYDSGGRWRVATGLVGLVAAVSVTGFAIFGGNGTPPNQALNVAVATSAPVEVAGAVEYATSGVARPLTDEETAAEFERGLALLDELVVEERVVAEVGDPEHWAVPSAVDEQDCVPSTVLVSESSVDVRAQPDPCTVEGSWGDALSADRFTSAAELTIAPIVPVANVVQSGGAVWNETTRRGYATDTTSPETLQTAAVASVVDRDGRAPDQWRPADQQTWCRYALDWVSVKTRFGLTATTAEVRTLRLMVTTCTVSSSDGPNPVHSRAERAAASVEIDPDLLREMSETDEAPGFELPCDPSYPDICVPPPPAVITCEQLGEFAFEVRGDDPHNFDSNGDGIGCDL